MNGCLLRAHHILVSAEDSSDVAEELFTRSKAAPMRPKMRKRLARSSALCPFKIKYPRVNFEPSSR